MTGWGSCVKSREKSVENQPRPGIVAPIDRGSDTRPFFTGHFALLNGKKLHLTNSHASLARNRTDRIKATPQQKRHLVNFFLSSLTLSSPPAPQHTNIRSKSTIYQSKEKMLDNKPIKERTKKMPRNNRHKELIRLLQTDRTKPTLN